MYLKKSIVGKYPSDEMYVVHTFILSSIVGEEKMEDFNNVMAEAFVFEGVGLSVAQHSVVRAIGMLPYREPESSKQIYQLMMK